MIWVVLWCKYQFDATSHFAEEISKKTEAENAFIGLLSQLLTEE